MAENRLKTFPLSGGEDYVTPSLSIPDGMARVAVNYEQNYNTGYTRVSGYRPLVTDVNGDEIIPGLAGATAHVTIFNDKIYLFKNIDLTEGGMWVATPTVYEDDGTVLGGNEGQWDQIVDIFDSSETPIATTLDPTGHYEFTINNFKPNVSSLSDYTGDWVSQFEYEVGDVINDAAGVIGSIDSKWITDVAHKSGNSLLNDSGFWHILEVTSEPNTGDADDISGDSGLLYGVDGVNPAFEFDDKTGTFGTITQIDSSYVVDTPMHIAASGNRLLLGFRSGEIAISQLGVPTGFNAVFGSGNKGVGDFLTGIQAGVDGTAEIYCKNRIFLVYGLGGPLDSSEMKEHSNTVGSYPYTQQKLGGLNLFFDTWGLTNLEVTQKFGDVITNALSKNIQTVFEGKQPIASCVLKEKSQYRLYFTDGTSTTCIVATLIADENIGFTHLEYPNIAAHGIASGAIGLDEVNIMGTADGHVYHMDVGNSFNGEEYTSYLTLPFNYLGSPHRIKKFRKVSISVESQDPILLQGVVDFSFGQQGHPSDAASDTISPSGARWNEGIWSDFYWGTGYSDYVESYINGHGFNVNVLISSTSATDRPHTLKDITFIYQYQRISH